METSVLGGVGTLILSLGRSHLDYRASRTGVRDYRRRLTSMDVIYKEGKLFLYVVRFGKRTWRKVWMMLFKPSTTGVGRLELSILNNKDAVADLKKIRRLKSSDRKVVRLSDCLSVIPAPKESCPPGCTAFFLHTTQCTYTLASTASQDWLSALCLLAFQKDPRESDKGTFERGNGLTMEDNDLYSSWKKEVTLPPNHYHVTVQSTEASRRCELAGEYLLSWEKEAMELLDSNTAHILYRWPYRLVRKFGQVEGGFSIEAGRRCESGEGVFVFLSSHAPQIFQAISKQCSVESTSSVPPPAVHRRSTADLSPVILDTDDWPPLPPGLDDPPDALAATEDDHYATINDTLARNVKRASLFEPRVSLVEGFEYEEERCHSLDALNMDNDMAGSIYYNVRRGTSPMIGFDEFIPPVESECLYSDVKVHPPLNPQAQPSLPPLPQPAPQPPCFTPPRPRHQRQQPASHYPQPGYNAQPQAVDDIKEMEEAISPSSSVTPTELPGSFKHRLANIICKDLAKFQPPLPSGAGSPPFSH